MLALTACGGSDGGDSTTGADGIKVGKGVGDSEINLGILTDYSGPIAQAATSGSIGLEIKLDQVEASGF
ncbi:hypothetical protein [Rhodococcus tukisamuensis]|nr:hypothetical protein [Rhodococcus tukisamuensis]